MKLRVAAVPPEGLPLDFEVAMEGRAGIQALADAEGCGFSGPAQAEIHIRPTGEVFAASGRFRVSVTLRCARCLSEFQEVLEGAFETVFRPDADPTSPDASDEVEIGPEDAGVIVFDGDEIDLAEVIEEQVLVHFPMKPLCREACKGLCAGCGADLNREPCRCGEPDVDPRLSVLKALKEQLPE